MQGFNMGRYVPPDLEGSTSGNKLHNKRAPGSLRSDGTQTVRFELPFAVWCHTCQPHAIMGQGVRFNAEKRRIGNYHSTPVWQFRMRHAACSGLLEIQTDPKNTAYVVTAGGKARDYGDDQDRVKEGHDGVSILTDQERERRRQDAFASLEAKVEEKGRKEESAKRIQELYRDKEKDWNDPWSANRRLRENHRRERKIRNRDEKATQALKDRLGTDMDILPAADTDSQRAQHVSFASSGQQTPERDSAVKPMISIKSSSRSRAKASRKDALRQQLIGNTRAALNPFG